MIRQLVTIGVAVMSTLLALVVLWEFHVGVGYVLLSLALAAAVRPFVVHWQSRGFMGRLGLAALYLLTVASFGTLIVAALKYAVIDLQQLAQTLSAQGGWNLPAWMGNSVFQQRLIESLPTPDNIFELIAGEQSQLVLPAVLSLTEGLGGLFSGLFLVLILSIYWSSNQVHFERLWLSLLASEQRKLARNIWRTIELEVGAYIRSEIVQSFLAAFLLIVGYWVCGARYPALLGLVGALLWLIPVVGVVLALILPFFIGLLGSIQLGIAITLYTLLILILLQIRVEPRLYSRKWDNSILTLMIMLALADAFGVMGIIIAPPLSAVCQIIWYFLVRNRLTAEHAVQISDLKMRTEDLKNFIQEMEEPRPPLVVNSMQRLAGLLEKAEPLLPDAVLPEQSPVMFHPSQSITKEDGS